MSTRIAGRSSRKLSIGTRLCPPAMILASPAVAASVVTAASTLSATRYSNGGGFMRSRYPGTQNGANGSSRTGVLPARPNTTNRSPVSSPSRSDGAKRPFVSSRTINVRCRLGKRDVGVIKRILTFVDEVRQEAGKPAQPPLRKVAAIAVIDNPFAGRYEPNLAPLTDASVAIGAEISAAAVALLGGMPESYGKAALIGMNGEQEHGVAMLTTVFGNEM